MNLRQIKAAGYKTTILTVITNSGELDLDFDLTTGETQSGRSVAQVTKK